MKDEEGEVRDKEGRSGPSTIQTMPRRTKATSPEGPLRSPAHGGHGNTSTLRQRGQRVLSRVPRHTIKGKAPCAQAVPASPRIRTPAVRRPAYVLSRSGSVHIRRGLFVVRRLGLRQEPLLLPDGLLDPVAQLQRLRFLSLSGPDSHLRASVTSTSPAVARATMLVFAIFTSFALFSGRSLAPALNASKHCTLAPPSRATPLIVCGSRSVNCSSPSMASNL